MVSGLGEAHHGGNVEQRRWLTSRQLRSSVPQSRSEDMAPRSLYCHPVSTWEQRFRAWAFGGLLDLVCSSFDILPGPPMSYFFAVGFASVSFLSGTLLLLK